MSGHLRDREAQFKDKGLDRIEVKEGRSAQVGGVAVTHVLPPRAGARWAPGASST